MKRGSLRIIGGSLRGRRLQIPTIPGLRPTPDRIRETLFNWLAPVIQEAHCLDAFAGTGALGFEACSRGAAYVEMVDQSKAVIDLLQSENEKLGTQAIIYQAEVPKALKKPTRPFDIVFLDPPYQSHLLLPTADYLEAHAFLAKEAYIYLESNQPLHQTHLPNHWQLLKQGQAGEVAYHLARRMKH